MSAQTEGRATGNSPGPDLEAEREIDLRRIWDGIKRQWWIVVAGMAVGVVVGAVYSLSGGSLYEATGTIAPGQAFSPGGNNAVLTYLTNQTAINTIATSETTIQEAAAKAGIPPGQLRGKVSTEGINEGGVSAARALLVEIRVRQPKKLKAEEAANAIAQIVKRDTTLRYVRKSLLIYSSRIKNFNVRLKSLQRRIDLLEDALAQPGQTLDQRLLLAIQLDQAQATQGQTIDSLTNAQQQLILAQDVQRTQIIQEARARKTTARSRRTSILVGALLGLLGGGIAAIVVDRRAIRSRPA